LLKIYAEFYAERARGDVGLIVTGGIAPNSAGRLEAEAAKMTTVEESDAHKIITDAVHKNGGKIAMQILHAGRYASHKDLVSASPIQSPITRFAPRALSSDEIYSTIDDFVNCSKLAKRAGYDGVEIMGSEGYFLNQFIIKKTNKRTDEWGGEYSNRIKLPLKIVESVRKAVGSDFIIIYRLSMLDLMDQGSTWEEIVQLAKGMEAAGVSILNMGVGWHEARIPTIATRVPRAGFAWVTKRLKEANLKVPICTSNRINTPGVLNQVVEEGFSDLVSMARPFLADPHFVKKAAEGRADEINTCIGCNQACLDHIFTGKRASCLVNPVTGFENSLKIEPLPQGARPLSVCVVGAGPAGLACAVTCAQRGHKVTLIEKDSQIGGQFNMAKLIPGKQEFFETLRYYNRQLELTGVEVKLGTEATAEALRGYDAVVVATGVTPRPVSLPVVPGGKAVNIVSYLDVLKHGAPVGRRVAIIGAGGIGFDVADFLTTPPKEMEKCKGPPVDAYDAEAVTMFREEWHIDPNITAGGLRGRSKSDQSAGLGEETPRQIYLLQRKAGKLGAGLGKSTGWIHRTTMKKRGVVELEGAKYIGVNDKGLIVERSGAQQVLEVDTVVLCAGQESSRELYNQLTENRDLQTTKQKVFMIGGAHEAGELDAKRAIDHGVRLGAAIEDVASGTVLVANYDH
jgi:2,4-dienoyl-CoA reductase (NADPH2)